MSIWRLLLSWALSHLSHNTSFKTHFHCFIIICVFISEALQTWNKLLITGFNYIVYVKLVHHVFMSLHRSHAFHIGFHHEPLHHCSETICLICQFHQQRMDFIYFVYTTHGIYFHTDVRFDIDGLVQERHNSIANALELRLSGTNPSICESYCWQCFRIEYDLWYFWSGVPSFHCRITYRMCIIYLPYCLSGIWNKGLRWVLLSMLKASKTVALTSIKYLWWKSSQYNCLFISVYLPGIYCIDRKFHSAVFCVM